MFKLSLIIADILKSMCRSVVVLYSRLTLSTMLSALWPSCFHQLHRQSLYVITRSQTQSVQNWFIRWMTLFLNILDTFQLRLLLSNWVIALQLSNFSKVLTSLVCWLHIVVLSCCRKYWQCIVNCKIMCPWSNTV